MSQLLIIDPATRHLEVGAHQHIKNCTSLTCQVVAPALPTQCLKGGALPNEESPAAVIILGSGASPCEEISWQRRLCAWLEGASGPLALGVPILAICYGHQLLGQIFGAPVEQLWGGEKSAGLRSLSLDAPRLGIAGTGPLVVSHREGLTALPVGWRGLTPSALPAMDCAGEVAYAVEAMVHEVEPWWGFQAHIEAESTFLQQNGVDVARPVPYLGDRILHAFLQYCAPTRALSS